MTNLLTRDMKDRRLSVDYPRQGETIARPRYTLRVSAPEHATNVEVALDQGPWLPCRRAEGYWWYDWSDYDSGEHEIVTRMETPEGLRISAEQHEFFVAP